jgi:hypothetical protein
MGNVKKLTRGKIIEEVDSVLSVINVSAIFSRLWELIRR